MKILKPILIFIEDQVCCKKKRKKKLHPRLILSINYLGATFKGINFMSLLLPDDRTATIFISSVDAHGHPASVENVSFSSTDEAVVTVDASGLITPVGIGSATINVIADSLIGGGEALLAGLLEVQVIAGQAVSLAVSATLNESAPI
jgi:hypothetical protein